MPHKDSMRICVLGNALSPHIQSRARVLADMGHDVTLLTADYAVVPGVKVRVIRPALRLPYCGWTIVFSYLNKIREIGPDVIHVHYASGFHSWVTTLLPRYPAVVSLMGKDILFKEQGNPTLASKRMTLDAIEQAVAITSKSEYMNAFLATVSPESLKKTQTIRWGIDLDRFNSTTPPHSRAQLDIGPEKTVLLCPRGLAPVYNIEVLLNALSFAVRKEPQLMLLLFEFKNDRGFKSQIIKHIKSLGLEDNVRILAQIPYSDMPGFFSLANIVISIPSSDGMPQTLFEALACEKPIIISDLPHYKEIVINEEEVLTVPVQAKAVSDALLRLLGNPQLGEAMGAKGKAMVKEKANFAKDAIKVEAILREAAGGRTQPRIFPGLRLSLLIAAHYAEAILTGKER